MKRILKFTIACIAISVMSSCSNDVSNDGVENQKPTPKPENPSPGTTDFNGFTYTINAKSATQKISPYIYGINLKTDYSYTTKDYSTMVRFGGNRTTAYNWENNASNAGTDWKNSSDSHMTSMVQGSERDVPGSAAKTFISHCMKNNKLPLFTIPMCYYVAADKKGEVKKSAKEDPSRWKINVPRKNAPFSMTPELNDNYVYADECVNFITQTIGGKGKVFYSLDNEPDLWQSTHPMICPEHITCDELLNRTIDYAKAIKDVDSEATIFGFVSYGYTGFSTFSSAPDWSNIKTRGNYSWFIDYYLDRIARETTKDGKRIVDVLDLHWYPEAKGDHRVNQEEAISDNDKAARLQAPRSLWDESYKENSWIANLSSNKLPLLPNVKKSIDKYCPGMKIAISEFNYGGYEDISGTLALADALGIFGKYDIFAACHWGDPGSYGNAAYQLYRNYDDKGSTFGSYKLESSINKTWEYTSLYASASETDCNQLHLMTINKKKDEAIEGKFVIMSNKSYTSAKVYYISQGSNKIKSTDGLKIKDNVLMYTIPAMTVAHIVIE